MRRSPWTLPLLAAAGVLLLALGDRALAGLLARLTLPTGGAQWIWEIRDRRDLSPAAFHAARDFTLETPPARARLAIGGDEEYVLYVNGARVGAGAWRPGAPLDVYEVGTLLQPGGNRLLVEMRSVRGTGGLLVSLDDGRGRQLAQTDESWRIFHQRRLGILRGWLPLAGENSPPSTAAACWGVPPVGRWGRPRLGPPRPLLGDVTRGRPEPAARALALPPLAGLAPDRPQPPRRLFDWGRDVAGYVLADLPPAAGRQTALLYLGADGGAPPDPLRQRPTAGLVWVPGQRTWMDAVPRRFRYALLVGPAGSRQGAGSMRVQPLDPRALAVLAGPSGPPRGVLGIVPPPLRTPVEDEVWRQEKSVAGVAGGKKR